MNRKKTMADLGRMTADEFHRHEKFPVAIVLDNVRSLNNIGSIFRSADAFRTDHICLCGITATPPSPEIHKTALGAEESVSWRHYESTADAIDQLRADGWIICAIEQADDSISLERFAPEPGKKYAIILGHEVYGVDQTIVNAADMTIEIPQFGTKHSLNVAVTAGILLWHLTANFITPANVK